MCNQTEFVCLVGISDTIVVGGNDFSQLTQRHGIKVGARSLHTVEGVALAVEEVSEDGYVKSAAQERGAVCGKGRAGEPAVGGRH